MDARDQDLFVIGPVKNADPAAFREITRGAPQKVVQQFGRAGMLEAERFDLGWFGFGYRLSSDIPAG